MSTLHLELVKALADLKRSLRSLGDKHQGFFLRIDCSAHDNDSPVKIEYGLSDSYYGQATKGRQLAPTIDEYKRRMGWNDSNEPLLIEAPAELSEPPNDNIKPGEPF